MLINGRLFPSHSTGPQHLDLSTFTRRWKLLRVPLGRPHSTMARNDGQRTSQGHGIHAIGSNVQRLIPVFEARRTATSMKLLD